MRSESQIQYDIRCFLYARGWFSLNMMGNAFQKGVPDLYCIHLQHGKRWIEVKRPDHYDFTKWQLIVFPQLEAHGDQIFVLVNNSMEEYEKLWEEPNWRTYLKPRHLKRMEKLRHLDTATWLVSTMGAAR